MAMYHFAIDISNHQGKLHLPQIEAFHAGGVERVIVRASTEDKEKEAIAQNQMQVTMDEGWRLDAYLWLYWDVKDPPENQLARVLDTYGKFPIRRLWIDCEGTPFDDALRNREWVWWAQSDPQMDYGIYSRPGWWDAYIQDSSFLDHLPKWFAGVNMRSLILGQYAMVQLGSMLLGDINVDIDFYRDDLQGSGNEDA